MAAPTVRARTAPATGMSATSNASTQIGDLVVLVSWERNASSTIPTFTLQGGGYVEILQQSYGLDGVNGGKLGIAYIVATAACAQSYTPYSSNTGGTAVTAAVVYQVGTFSTTGIALASTSDTTDNVEPDSPSVTLTNTTDYSALAIGAWHCTSRTIAPTAPTGYANLIEVAGAATLELAIADKAVTGSSSEDPSVWVDNIATGLNGTAAATVAIPGASGTAYTITCDAGSFSLTGTDATVSAGYSASAAAGSYAITGTDASMTVAWLVTAGAGSVDITGTAASITYASSQVTNPRAGTGGSRVHARPLATVRRGEPQTVRRGDALPRIRRK